jgi:hypothetical protein
MRLRRIHFEVCLENVTLGKVDAICGIPGKSAEDMLAVLIYILDARSLL